jgi:CRISPR-associated protein Cas5t
MEAINVMVSVPICSFRKPYAREFLESERFPPPATIYGFLLSLIGEEERAKYIKTKLAIAVIREPKTSLILRTVWRVKNKKAQPGRKENRRPDYQEILTGLKIGVWVASGELTDRLRELKETPESIERFGGLSLGESRDLVDEVIFQPSWENKTGNWLIQDEKGQNPLPVWVDHVGSKGTNWSQFSIREAPLEKPPDEDSRWIVIEPPG